MLENTIYLVSEDVAKRAGVYNVAYVTKDRRFLLDAADIRRVSLRGDEYIHGLSDVEILSKDEAAELIRENKYRRIEDMDSEEEEEVLVEDEAPVEDESRIEESESVSESEPESQSESEEEPKEEEE